MSSTELQRMDTIVDEISITADVNTTTDNLDTTADDMNTTADNMNITADNMDTTADNMNTTVENLDVTGNHISLNATSDSFNTSGTIVLDTKANDTSLSAFSLRTIDRVESYCSVTSSVMGPQTYRPPYPDDEGEEDDDDDVQDVLDLRLRNIKSRIESEMRETRMRPPPPMPPCPPALVRVMHVAADCILMPPPAPPVEDAPLIGDDSDKTPADPTVVLDPSSGRVVPIAALPWHQRYALSHPYFRNMPYLPPQIPFIPPSQVPGSQAGYPNLRGRGRTRTAPLVRYIPGGFKDINRQSSFSPIDFSSELMSYVRMRKEMLKMDLREKIRQRKEDLVKSQRRAFEGERNGGREERNGGREERNGGRDARRDAVGREAFGGRYRPHQASDASIQSPGKNQYYYRDRERENDIKRTREPSPPPTTHKTPREVWQSRMLQKRDRSSSPSSSSGDETDDDKKRDSRRKWIAQRKAAMLAKTAAIRDKIKREKAAGAAKYASKGKETDGRKSPVVPISYRCKNESPEKYVGKRSPIAKPRGLREWKNSDYLMKK